VRFLIGSSIFYIVDGAAGYHDVCQGTGARCYYLFDCKGKSPNTSLGVSITYTSSMVFTWSATLPLFCLMGISILIPNELLFPTSVGKSSEIANEYGVGSTSLPARMGLSFSDGSLYSVS
jgi:hypothetical protein